MDADPGCSLQSQCLCPSSAICCLCDMGQITQLLGFTVYHPWNEDNYISISYFCDLMIIFYKFVYK